MYPDLDKLFNHELNEINKVKEDFPLLTDTEIESNINDIIDIYQKQIRYTLFGELFYSNLDKAVLSRGDYPGGTNSQEFWLLFFNALMIDGTSRATNNASAWAVEKFSNTSVWRDKGDAYRHAAWNTLICCYVPGSKAAKIDWAKKFTDAHENGSPAPDDIRDNAMDFHNNSEGRTYFNSNSSESWFLFFVTVTVPSDSTVKEVLYQKAVNAIKFSDNNQLPSLVGNLVYFM